MRKPLIATLLLVLSITAAAIVGCAGGGRSGAEEPATRARPITDVDSLIAHLREAGFHAERADTISQPFFTPQATVIRVNDEEMQVYQYPDETSATREAAGVGVNGRSVGTSQVGWIAPPHFFRKSNLIVVYLGSNREALLTLRGLLGDQFAGN